MDKYTALCIGNEPLLRRSHVNTYLDNGHRIKNNTV